MRLSSLQDHGHLGITSDYLSESLRLLLEVCHIICQKNGNE